MRHIPYPPRIRGIYGRAPRLEEKFHPFPPPENIVEITIHALHPIHMVHTCAGRGGGRKTFPSRGAGRRKPPESESSIDSGCSPFLSRGWCTLVSERCPKCHTPCHSESIDFLPPPESMDFPPPENIVEIIIHAIPLRIEGFPPPRLGTTSQVLLLPHAHCTITVTPPAGYWCGTWWEVGGERGARRLPATASRSRRR